MIETVLALLTGGASGGILGIAGAYLTKREERQIAQLKFTHEEKMGELRLKEVAGEREHALALKDKEIQLVEKEGEIKGWASTLVDESSKSTLGMMVKAAIRPTITLYLLAVTSYLTINIWTIVNGLEGLPEDEVLDIFRNIIAQILFLTNTCVTWWFGARASSQPAIR